VAAKCLPQFIPGANVRNWDGVLGWGVLGFSDFRNLPGSPTLGAAPVFEPVCFPTTDPEDAS